MKWEYIEKNWADFRGKVKGLWNLSDEEFDAINGDREEFIKALEGKGLSRAEAEHEIDDFSKTVIGKGVTWTEARGA